MCLEMGPSLAVSKHELGDETGKSLREGLICRATRNPGSLALLSVSIDRRCMKQKPNRCIQMIGCSLLRSTLYG